MKKIYADIKKVFESTTSFRVLCGIGIIIVALLIFAGGVTVGFYKASYGRSWGENYERNFGLKASRLMFDKDNFPNANGAAGKIIKIQLPTIIVQDKDNTEKIILIKDDTQIQEMRNSITANDLKINDFAVVIGIPDEQGQIEAKLIRIMPFGLTAPSTTQTPAQ